MAISITCPGCQSVYPVPETLAGKTIRCKKCGEMMPVAAAPPAAAPVAAPVAARPVKPAPRVVVEDDGDDVAIPARPARRPRVEVDEDDAPRPRGDKPAAKKKSPLPLILGGVAAVVVLAGGAVAVVFGTGLLGGKPVEPVAHGGEKLEKRTPGTGGPVGGGAAVMPKPEEKAVKPAGEPVQAKPAEGNGSGTSTAQLPTKSGETAPLVVDPLKPAGQPATPAGGGPTGFTRMTLDPVTLAKCKAATVYIEVETKNGLGASGTGWFGLEPNLIFTNAHVVFMKRPGSPKPAKITVTVNPGTPREKEIPHSRLEILAVDRERDLALLQVLNEKDLPAPLAVRPTGELNELDRLFVIGYPGGKRLSYQTSSTKAPAVTVNNTSVGAVRRDDNGNISKLQTQGGAYHGNSGGPIVDPDGNVRGVLQGAPDDDAFGSAVNYAVPTEYVTGLVAGRVGEVEYGQPFRKDGKIHVPVTAHCVDPFQRLKAVGVACWVGDDTKRTRPPGPERTGAEPTDANYAEVALTYKHGKDDPVATGELVLPELPAGRVYWSQPFYSNALVSRYWQAGNPIKLVGPPVDLEPADLIVRYKPGVRRPITLSDTSSFYEFEEGEGREKNERLMVETEMKATEHVVTPNDKTAAHMLRLDYEKFGLKAERGPLSTDKLLPLEVRELINKGLSQVHGYGYVNKTGEIYRTASDVRAVGRLAPLFKVISDDALASLQGTAIPLPNTRVEPKFTWGTKTQRRLALAILEQELPGAEGGRPGGGIPHPAQPRTREYKYVEDVKFTYLGSRVRTGQKEAVVQIEGKVTAAPGAKATEGASGVVKGFAYIDINTGTVLDAEVEIEFEIDTSANNIKKRLSGINKFKLTRGSAITG